MDRNQSIDLKGTCTVAARWICKFQSDDFGIETCSQYYCFVPGRIDVQLRDSDGHVANSSSAARAYVSQNDDLSHGNQ
jgi:hypothetical protein